MTDDLDPQALDYSHPETAEKLWEAFYQRLRLAVRDRVKGIRRPVASESEVALSAMNSFINRARDGQFQDLADEQELWRLLKTIAIRKTNDLRKNLRAKKRGGQNTIFNESDASTPSAGVERAVSNEDGPTLEAELSEMFTLLLERLPDERHRDAILLKLQGASVATIAEHLATTTRTVQRMLKKIEQDWHTNFLDG